MKPKIVLTHLLNNYTGSPKVLSHVIPILRQEGYEVHLFTNKGPGFLDEVEVDKRVNAWYSWHPNKYIRLFNFVLSQVLLFFSLLRYWRQPVVVYANTILPFGAGLSGKFMGKKVLYHIHETEFQPPAFTRFLMWVVHTTADQLLFVSRYLQEFHDIRNIPQKIVYNALSPDFQRMAQETVKEKALEKPELKVLMICSLKKAKGIFEYIELARELPKVSFTLVISQSPDQINRFLGKTVIPANLNLLPVQKNVHQLYKEADLLLSLSYPHEWPETFGMTIVEGLTYGLPAIVPPVGAPIEIIHDGVEGFHLDVRELDQIRDKIQELADKPQLMERLSHAAQIRSKDFSMASFKYELMNGFSCLV